MKNILIVLMSLLLSQTLTAQVPELIYDFDSGCGWSTEWQLTKVGNKLFFRGCTDEDGRELWTTDGTVAGTEMITELAIGGDNGLTETSELKTILGNELFFLNKLNSAELALWKTDGTVEGTGIIADGSLTIVGNAPPVLRTYGAHVYYYGRNDLTDEEGILRTDGTGEGTELIINDSDLLTGGKWIIEEDKIFYFKFESGERKVKFYDLITGEIGTIETDTEGDVKTSYIGYHNGNIMYIVELIADVQIWRANTEEMIGEPISDFISGFGVFVRPTDSPLIYFGSSSEKKLYSKSGDDENTILVSEEIGNYTSLSSEKAVIGDKLYFLQEFNMWSTDGTLSGTTQLFENAELPHMKDGYLYYGKSGTPSGGNDLRRFKEEDPLGTNEQVGGDELDIYRPDLFNTGLDNKLVFVSRTGLYAVNLQPSSIFNEKSERTELTVFPNPAQNELEIPLPDDLRNRTIELSIQNISGQEFFTQELAASESIKLTLPPDLINGMYFVKLSTGKNIAFGKVMILK